EYPANSGLLYVVNPGGPFWSVSAPDIDLDVWAPCEVNPPADTGPCNGSESVGVWNDTSVPVIGDVYEYPANSGMYYEIIFDHEGNISKPDGPGNEEFWSPIDCPCEESWVDNGQPVWDATVDYPGNYVVAWPFGSNNLYVPLEPTGVMSGAEPGVDPHWIHCVDSTSEPITPAVTGPCNGSDSVGVWNSTSVSVIGDVYEYPANSGSYYEVIYVDLNGLISTAPGEDQDYEFWSPIDCTCEESWVANGQPVWDATVDYPGNYVVAWPFGSNNLYVPLEPTGVMSGAEPGVDLHWIHCVDPTPEQIEPAPEDGWLPSIGVFGTVVAISMAVLITRRRI
ncbi:MAG TPA: hypothetical protein QF555_01220, partial [Candidatus Thalassarchaeaceae archaeon]|nr:hypothetical protein [Candidatus Thalassarchaeaceae archaeon]